MIFSRVANDSGKPRRKVSPSFLVSLGVHVVVAAALMRMLILHIDLSPSPRKQAAEERVGFVNIARPGEKPVAGKVGGDGRPFTPREIHVVAPRIVPNAIPMPNVSVAKPTEEPGNGPLVGGGGPSRGVRPSYSDGRVWEPPGAVVARPKTVKETIDSLIADGIAPYNDSIAAAAQRRDPTDWTVEKGGYKWGIDRHEIGRASCRERV